MREIFQSAFLQEFVVALREALLGQFVLLRVISDSVSKSEALEQSYLLVLIVG